jgi:hypothetical protein
MKMRKTKLRAFVPAPVLAACLAISGCHSHLVECMIDNRTGATIHQVEIDYPSASFGVNTLNPGQVYSYKFKVQGSGLIKVQYADSTAKQVQLQGTTLAQGDQGQYVIILLPDGKVRWVPSLNYKN